MRPSPLWERNFAVVGATGNVGYEFLSILSQSDVSPKRVTAIASSSSAGKEVSYGDGATLKVRALDDYDFEGIDIVLASAGAAVSRSFAPRAADAGALVIDNSSAFRMEKDVPLVVPEINLEDAVRWRKRGIVANPNCSTIQMLIALADAHRLFGVSRVEAATYQSVSGAGTRAMDEMFDQTRKILVSQDIDEELEGSVFPRRIAYNVIPQIDDFMEDVEEGGDLTKEEWKMRVETKKILDATVEVEAICARVPVFIGHGIAVFANCFQEVDLAALRGAWEGNPAISVSTPTNYVTAVESSRTDFVYVSRLRRATDDKHRFCFWCVSDNLLKGAALNALQIAEGMLRNKWL